MMSSHIKDIDLAGKSVFLRLDLNVPQQDGKILDDTRIISSLKTITYILERTNKLCIATHLGRPKGIPNPKFSLVLVAARLAELLNKEILLVEDYQDEPIDQLLLQTGKDQIVLLENLRFHQGELSNDKSFAQKLMKGIDIYINDAFATIHRSHASIVEAAKMVTKENRAVGFLLAQEIQALKKLKTPQQPFVLLLGGSKVSDKIGLILNMMNLCTDIMIAGAMAYTFLKFNKNKIGLSKVENDKLELVEMIYRNAKARGVRIHLPIDHVCAKEFSEDAEVVAINQVDIPDNLIAMDIGPNTCEKFKEVITKSKTVFWNGPMGVFEWDSFAQGSISIAKHLNNFDGFSAVGGGDSLAVIKKSSLLKNNFSYTSTGGGACLALLEGKELTSLKLLE
jgi:phosphoglycerate kinase